MKAEIKKLFEQLNAYWFMSGTGYEGENPGCYELQLQILNEIKQMEVVDAVKLINELSDSQINQINRRFNAQNTRQNHGKLGENTQYHNNQDKHKPIDGVFNFHL